MYGWSTRMLLTHNLEQGVSQSDLARQAQGTRSGAWCVIRSAPALHELQVGRDSCAKEC